MKPGTIILRTGFFPPDGYEMSGRVIAGKTVYWCARIRPRALLKVEWSDTFVVPENFAQYYDSCCRSSEQCENQN